ncbi:MAG: hypothetical protein R2873_18345 [Caldilineaceae bacterium]
MTLSERLSSAWMPNTANQEDNADAAQYLEIWRRNIVGDGADLFMRRLAQDGRSRFDLGAPWRRQLAG